MDNVVDEFLDLMKTVSSSELKEMSKVLDERLESIITYKKDIETLENKVLEKDRERFKALRKYESSIKELYDIDKKIKELKEEIQKLESKKEKIKINSTKYRQKSDKSAREFLKTKNELKERRKLGVNSKSTIKVKKKKEKIDINSLYNKKITINGATSIGKIDRFLINKESNNSKKIL